MSLYNISKTVFNPNTVLKVVYLFQEDFSINVTENSDNYLIEVNPLKDNVCFDFEDFNKQLLEQQLRENLNSQFGTLRNAIYNKAFEHFER